MIPVVQTNPGDRGNCMAACWASILETDVHEVPDYRAIEAAGGPWLNVVNTWLSKHHGRVYVELDWYLTEYVRPRGFHLINGAGHSVVGYNGLVFWDPRGPGAPGISLVDNYGLLVDLTEDLMATWEPEWGDCVCPRCVSERAGLVLPAAGSWW